MGGKPIAAQFAACDKRMARAVKVQKAAEAQDDTAVASTSEETVAEVKPVAQRAERVKPEKADKPEKRAARGRNAPPAPAVDTHEDERVLADAQREQEYVLGGSGSHPIVAAAARRAP